MLKYEKNELFVDDSFNRKNINYANGCIEDPRLFYFANELYLSIACRVFPPGPYWDHDDSA
jgi:beta-1,2-mannobiose phosphorylase / 1,2-beta-oligomannan phosphorylase